MSATGKHVVSSHGLRLHLPGELVEDGREKATYDLESGGLRADPMDLVVLSTPSACSVHDAWFSCGRGMLPLRDW